MLRSALLICGVVFLAIGLTSLLTHCYAPPGWPFIICGTILIIAVLCERWRYQHVQHTHDERWRQTDERFEDPETGQTVEVLYDPATGERRYVRASGKTSP